MRYTIIALVLLLTASVSSAQLPNTSVGLVERIENFPSDYISARHVDIWTPENYDTTKKYPVLYMHDGQMLFDSTLTWNKQEWKVDEVLTKLIDDKKIQPHIVVAIHNSKERHADYFPQKPFDILPPHIKESYMPTDSLKRLKSVFPNGPHADDYLSFIVKELKPYIDATFPTLVDSTNTAIAGSSMGGLISMYAMFEYPDIFGSAACLSTHWIGGMMDNAENPVPAAFQHYMTKNMPDPNTHKIYFDHGTLGLDAMYKIHQLNINDTMRDAGYVDGKNLLTKVYEGHDHNERYWSQRLGEVMEYLLN